MTTTADWPLALTVCLILSIGWAALLFAACRIVESFLPAAEDRHLLWSMGLVTTAAPLAALAVTTGLSALWPGGAGSAPFLGGVLGPAAASAGSGQVSAAGGGDVVTLLLAILRVTAPFAVAVYGGGVLWRGCSGLRARSRLRRILAACRPLEGGALDQAVANWAARLNLKQTPPVLLTREQVSPFSARRRRPVLVLPEGLLRRCPAEQTVLICAHEMAHLARRDLQFMRIQSIICALLWFNPVAGLIARRLDATRETACDDLVLNIDRRARRDYARAFLQALRHSSAMPVCGIPFIHPHRKDHEMRLTHILSAAPLSPKKTRLALACLAMAAIAAPVAGVQAALAESLARTAPEFAGAVVASSGARLTSPFGPRKLKGQPVFHGGVDIAAPLGAPVLSPGKGRVLTVTAEKPAYGKLVEIDYGDDWRLRFAQLDSWLVAEGDEVDAGQQIGTVGQSGKDATGPHLHLEVWRKGKIVDPATVLDLPGPYASKEKAAEN